MATDDEVARVKALIVIRGLEAATDDQLRAECVLRQIDMDRCTPECARLQHERDAYRQKMEREADGRAAAAAGWATASQRCVELERECAEWKQRAEATVSQPTEVYAVVQSDWSVSAHELNGKYDGVMLTHERDNAKVFLSPKMIGRISAAAWAREGEDFKTLTLTPSLQYPCWHGWVEDGLVINITEATHCGVDEQGQKVALSPRQVAQLRAAGRLR